jgi:hypothetical protein
MVFPSFSSRMSKTQAFRRFFALFGGKSHQKQSKNMYFLLILLDFFHVKKGILTGDAPLKGH